MAPAGNESQNTANKQDGLVKIVVVMGVIFTVVTVVLLGSVVGLALRETDSESAPAMTSTGSAATVKVDVVQTNEGPQVTVVSADGTSTAVEKIVTEVLATAGPPAGENPCAGQKPDVPNVECVIDAVVNVGPQSGANVTKGYNGDLETTSVPVTSNYWEVGMCPVNVHWHLGAEHLSVGEYDETGTGPQYETGAELDDETGTEPYGGRRRLAGPVRQGFRCKHYNENDPKFTTEYDWQHCIEMKVGETYEIHWPHSAAGACGTINQYQTPFYDGVFCRDGVLTDTAAQIGVQGQVFTIVNDEDYYYPDLIRGMIVDGEMGADIAKYTGSTTGTTRNNEVCSQYSPITWQVDRKCHMISASSFDKLCADMKAQRDDMTLDLHAHGSRELVADHLAANNHQNLRHLEIQQFIDYYKGSD